MNLATRTVSIRQPSETFATAAAALIPNEKAISLGKHVDRNGPAFWWRPCAAFLALAAGQTLSTTAAHAAFQQAVEQKPTSVSSRGMSNNVPSSPQSDTQRNKPNIALILLDDAGFAATSMYGGMADTPAFEQLAQTGVRYNRFHVTAICSPTRAALLSGRNPHQVGFGQIPETAMNYPGYNTIWPKSAASIAEHLKRFGYGTAAFGKWHNTPSYEWSPAGPFNRWPTGLGFENFYGTIGTTSAWEPLLWQGTTAVEPLSPPDQPYYLTTDLVDHAIKWLHTRETLVPDKPYFLYFATTATHSPHQVGEQWVTPYKGKFDEGWDMLRTRIFAQQKRLGIIPADAVLTPRPPDLPAWISLSSDEKVVAERQMEILAGFMSETDHEVDRLIRAIRSGPNGEDTLIILIAGDNGSSGDDGLAGCDDCPLQPPSAKTRLKHLSELNGPERDSGSAAAWAFMNDTPFPGMKRDASHLGGTRTPMVISWPGHTRENATIRSQWLDVTDVAPTIYDVVGYKPPDKVDDVEQLPLAGTSFAQSFQSPSVPSAHHTQYFETFGSRALYQDGWMASLPYLTPWDLEAVQNRAGPQADKDKWELYNIDQDFSQARDLATANPEKLKALINVFREEAQNNNVYPLGVSWKDHLKSPSLTQDRTDYTFFPDSTFYVWDAIPDFEVEHRITTRINLSDTHAKGLIISSGMRGRGFALYMKDGKLIYESEQANGSSHVSTSEPLPAGEHEITVEVSAGNFYKEGTRRIKLYLGAELAASGEVADSIEPFYGSATLCIAAPHGSPVSPSLPQTFSGRIEAVHVHFSTPSASP